MDIKTEVLPQFRTYVAAHKMTVVRDDGVHRHLRFAKPGTGCFSFDLITWPGSLCISGDCGAFVFTRLHDMFEFFRTALREDEPSALRINLSYWSEKLTAADPRRGFEQFSMSAFKAAIKRRFDEHFEESEVSAEVRAECWQAIEDEVINEDAGEEMSHVAARDFSFKHPELRRPFEFVDFWEANCNEYNFHFVWNCYAIAWAIGQYDASKPVAPPAAVAA